MTPYPPDGLPGDGREDVVGMTDAYVHGLLSGPDAEFVLERAGRDPMWAMALERAEARLRAARALPACEPSEALFGRALEAARRADRRGLTRRRVFTRYLPAAFAAGAVLLLILQAYLSTVAPRGYDLTVLGQTRLAAGAPASLRIRLSDGATSTPAAGVPVELSIADDRGRRTVLASFSTNALGTGSPRFTVPDWAPGEYTVRVAAGRGEAIERAVKLERASRLMLSTDKPVYQPGQTIRVRALALRRADGRPVARGECVFTVTDPRGTVVFKQRTPTSGFGIASADCPLAGELLHGAYTVRCAVDGTESERSVEVRPYALPKFRVALDVDEPYLRPGQVVRARVKAGYFFGRPVAGGEAAVELSPPPPAAAVRATVRLDADGAGVAELRVPDRMGAGPEAGEAVTITATVTDAAGQGQSAFARRVVSARELVIEVLPEGGALVPGVANTVYVLVATPDGRPAPSARLDIAGAAAEVICSELGVGSFELTPPALPAGAERSGGGGAVTRVTVRATDRAGRTAVRTVELSPRTLAGAFLFRTDAGVYAAGGTVRATVLGGGVEPVFVDVLKDGQTVLTRAVDVVRGRGELVLDLPPELTGALELIAYRFGPSGLAARQARAVLVEAAGGLRVAVATDKPVYRPGERATISVAATDASGAPAPCAVSLAAVDEAVYSVLEAAPGTEAALRALDQELLRPVLDLFPWRGSRAGTAAELELERALFSATARERPSGRDAALRRLVDEGSISEDMLEALQSPRAAAMIADLERSGSMSPQAAAVLRGGAAEFSLSGSTWPEKVQRAERLRREGRSLVAAAWWTLGGALALVLLAAVWVFVTPRIVEVVLVLVVIALLIGCLLPALGKARSSARSLRDLTSMRGLGQALDLSGAAPEAATPSAGPTPVRVRSWFPETLLWRPEVVTDDAGRATVEVELADSVTTWRVLGGAVDRAGRLGSVAGTLRVFQPFFVDLSAPAGLTRGDETTVGVVVYNYLGAPQSVRLSVAAADWFELPEGGDRTVELAPGEVRSVGVRIRAVRAGVHELEIRAAGEGDADAVRRTVEVRPGGRPLERAWNGRLHAPLEAAVEVPQGLIDGSGRLLVKIYPSPMSQFVEGLEGLFQAPHGCFEQTSSTTYPSVLALDYLRRSGKAVPAVEAKARGYIHLGYQRLLTFEVAGGGFDWFGRPPANRLLTAYGLMEFEDMARVHDVDPALIARTRAWLMAQRRSDGSWAAESHGLESGALSRGGPDADLLTTAYLAWAVFGGAGPADAGTTRAWLEAVRPDRVDDPYVAALLAHAAAATGGDHRRWASRLVALRRSSDDGALAWWERPAGARTAFCGAGRAGDVEATALAALALIRHGGEPGAARGALAWLARERDALGTWGTTQATVLALKALVAAAGATAGTQEPRAFTVEVDGREVRRLAVGADQADVLQQLDLSEFIAPGARRVTVRQTAGPASEAQVVFRGAVPGPPEERGADMAVSVEYARLALRAGETLAATARVRNAGPAPLPMVMLTLPVPPGFAAERGAFDGLVSQRRIARYEVTPRSVVVYLLGLRPGEELALPYELRAVSPGDVFAEAPTAYEYYAPARRAEGALERLRVDSTD